MGYDTLEKRVPISLVFPQKFNIFVMVEMTRTICAKPTIWGKGCDC